MTGAGPASAPLACPACGRSQADAERFCADCGMPLAPPAGETEPSDPRRDRARKIDPRYSEGDLVRVAGGRHQAEAELIQGMLLEEGVPSVLRRSAGFDVPDMLAAGPRDVLVPNAGVEAARAVLLEADLAPPAAPARSGAAGASAAGRLTAVVLGGGALTALVTWALLRLTA